MSDALPIICSKRLVLRGFEIGDAGAVALLAGDREIANTTLMLPYPYDRNSALRWISTHPQRVEAGELVSYAITSSIDGQLFGTVSLSIDTDLKIAELGYWIGRLFWNRGICSEAARLLLRHGFETLKLHRVHARHMARNPASGAVMQKLGMQQEGVARQHAMKWGHYEDLVLYGILAQEWLSQESCSTSLPRC